MLTALRFDFYKLFKSKTLRIYLYLTAALLFIFVTIMPLSDIKESVLELLQRGNMGEFLIIGFAIFFIFQDYNRKFVKNIYRDTNKAAYVFSKFLIILLYVLAVYVVHFIFTVIVTYTVGIKKFLPIMRDDIKISYYIIDIFMHMGLQVAFGFLIVTLSFMIRNEIVVFIVVIAYAFFLSDVVFYNVTGIIVTKINPKSTFNISDYMLISHVVHPDFLGFGSLPYIFPKREAFICLHIIIFYIVTSPLVSWWLYAKRNV